MRVVIMIPTYNEKDNIKTLLDELLARTDKLKKHTFRILVVDDNSPDGTGKIVKDYSKKNKNIFLLSGIKQGLGKAMIRGYKYVLKNFKSDVVVTNEADFGFSFSHLPKMLEQIEKGDDVVVTSRHVKGGKSEGWTLNRKVNHWIANTLFAKIIAGINSVEDKNGAMRAIRTTVLKKINFNKFPTKGFSFFFYQIYALSKLTSSFYEIPTTFHFRTTGESKISFNPKYIRTYARDVLEYMNVAFQIRQERVR